MKNTGKYKIVTGITAEHKVNSENPKYFAKFKNDNIHCVGNSQEEAISRLRSLYEEYKEKNKLYGFASEKVLNTKVVTIKSKKYQSLAMEFFELINEDPYHQINDESTFKDCEITTEQMEKIYLKYGVNVKASDLFVEIFEKIEHRNY